MSAALRRLIYKSLFMALKTMKAAFIGAALAVSASISQAQDTQSDNLEIMRSMGVSGLRAFERACQNNGVLYAEFLPSEYDLLLKVSPNGHFLHEVHPTGMKSYMPEAGVEGLLKKLNIVSNPSDYLLKTRQEMRKALDALHQTSLNSAPQCQ